ncbi:hypothetical protein FHT86_003504 [Rhizobium sp. BK313]|nr:hypothetical protein [Rhizobium sp. BK313]
MMGTASSLSAMNSFVRPEDIVTVCPWDVGPQRDVGGLRVAAAAE